MKTKLLFLFLLVLGAGNVKADDSVSGVVIGQETGTDWTMHVTLTNAVNYVAFQLDIDLPAGMTVQSVTATTSRLAQGDDVEIGGETTETPFVVSWNTTDTDNNIVRVVGYNLGNHAISPESGDCILNLKLTSSESMSYSAVSASFSNVKFVQEDDLTGVDLAATDASGMLRGDANCSGTVNVADITAIVTDMYGSAPTVYCKNAADINETETINVADITGIVSIMYGSSTSSSAKSFNVNEDKATITINNASVKAGEESSLTININSQSATAFQMDITAPEGLSFLNTQLVNDNSHILHAQYLKNGVYKIVCYSLDNTPLSETGISTLKLSLVTDNSIEDGEYNMMASDIVLSKQGNEEKLDNVYGLLQIGNTTTISDVNLSEKENDSIYDIQGRKLNTVPRKSVYIKNGNKYIK